MSTYKLSRRLENATSDEKFLEECIQKKIVPKTLQWKIKINGLDKQFEEKVEKIKDDAAARVLDVMVKGMRHKRMGLEKKQQEGIDKVLEQKKGWEGIKWMEKIDGYQKKCRNEAEERKERHKI